MLFTIYKHEVLQNGNYIISYKDERGNGTWKPLSPEEYEKYVLPKLKGRKLISFQFQSQLHILDAFYDYFGIRR